MPSVSKGEKGTHRGEARGELSEVCMRDCWCFVSSKFSASSCGDGTILRERVKAESLTGLGATRSGLSLTLRFILRIADNFVVT